MKQRLFLAIPLPQPLQETLTEALAHFQSTLSDKQQEAIRFIPAENWHITIYFFGDVPVNQIEWLQKRIEEIVQATPAFVLIPDQLLLSPPEKEVKKMLWLSFQVLPALTELSWQVYRNTEEGLHFHETTLAQPRPVLIPHVTVARFKHISPEILPLPVVPSLIFNPLLVQRCELWRSALGEHGALYNPIAEFRFATKLPN
ncbi:MAG: RNA 2',3'-cyclic phosphodiesterase [Bacteroidota bacterium]